MRCTGKKRGVICIKRGPDKVLDMELASIHIHTVVELSHDVPLFSFC